jgi:hypothetical protein
MYHTGWPQMHHRRFMTPLFVSAMIPSRTSILLLLWRFGPFSGHCLPNLLPLLLISCYRRPPVQNPEQVGCIPLYGIFPSISWSPHWSSSSKTVPSTFFVIRCCSILTQWLAHISLFKRMYECWMGHILVHFINLIIVPNSSPHLLAWVG